MEPVTNSHREDVHTLVAAQMDRTDARRPDAVLCDYLEDLVPVLVNLLAEEQERRLVAVGLPDAREPHEKLPAG